MGYMYAFNASALDDLELDTPLQEAASAVEAAVDALQLNEEEQRELNAE